MASFEHIAEYLDAKLKKELVVQQHVASEKLFNSIHTEVFLNRENIIFNGYGEFYGRFVDTGRKPGVRKVPIKALERWIRIKRFEFDAKKIRGLAFAIQTTIFNEGIPTKGSRLLAPRRTEWVTRTLEHEAPNIKIQLEDAVGDDLQLFVDNMVREARSFTY